MLHELTDKYERIKLNPLKEEEIESLRILRNKHKDCFIYTQEISPQEQEIWFEKYKTLKDDYIFSVYYKDTWVGAVSLYNIEKGSTEFGRIIVDSSLVNQKGLGLEATICVCNIGFQKLNLERIYLEVYSDNKKAIKMYKKAGFIEVSSRILNNDKKLIIMEIKKQ